MLYARPAQSFDITLSGAPTGLTGTLGVRVIDQPAGTTIVARTTAGISEQPAGSGIYSATLTAPSTAGTYLVVWDTGGVTPVYASEELQVTYTLPIAGPTDAMPSVDDVAALLQERTWANGVQQGTFNADTTPTADQAQRLIDLAVEDVLIAFGGTVPDGYESRARMLATLRAATLIENSFFRRDVESGTSPYAQYQAMYLADLERLGDDPGVNLGAGGFASVRLVPAVVDPLARLLP